MSRAGFITAHDEKPKTVLLNGCFDGLHDGHRYLLKMALGFGQVVLGLNSDASIKALKGETRPVFNFEERANAIQEEFPSVDIIEFDGEAVRLARKINPDVIIRGWDQDSERGLPCAVVRISRYDTNTEENLG